MRREQVVRRGMAACDARLLAHARRGVDRELASGGRERALVGEPRDGEPRLVPLLLELRLKPRAFLSKSLPLRLEHHASLVAARERLLGRIDSSAQRDVLRARANLRVRVARVRREREGDGENERVGVGVGEIPSSHTAPE